MLRASLRNPWAFLDFILRVQSEKNYEYNGMQNLF